MTHLQIAEFTGRYRRMLRRYRNGTKQDCPKSGYHNAVAEIGDIGEEEHITVSGDNWPHDDPRWPQFCPCGSYWFSDDDNWMRNDNRIFRMPDGTEFTFWGAFGRCAPPGAMIRADWYDDFSSHPQKVESWVVALPDGGEWITSQRATDGQHWTVTGTPPDITVSPSIHHNAPTGWHGFIRNGELVLA
jgi:hypothetical protein